MPSSTPVQQTGAGVKPSAARTHFATGIRTGGMDTYHVTAGCATDCGAPAPPQNIPDGVLLPLCGGCCCARGAPVRELVDGLMRGRCGCCGGLHIDSTIAVNRLLLICSQYGCRRWRGGVQRRPSER